MKKFISKKMIAAWIIAFFVGLYSTFVALCLWNWFAVPYLHLPSISYLQLWGLMLLGTALMRGNFTTATSSEQGRWATLGQAVEMCIPDEKQQAWKEYWDMEPARMLMESVGGIIGAFATNTLVLVLGFVLRTAMSRPAHFRGPDDHPATQSQISQVKIFNGSLSATPEPVTGGPENNKLSNGYEFDGYIQNNLTVEISFIRMRITIFDCPEAPVSDTYAPSPPSDCKNIGDDEEDEFPHAAPGESVGFSNFHFSQRPLLSLRWNYEITEMDTEKASSPGPAPKPDDVYYREQPWPGDSRDYIFPDGSIITTPAGYALINDDDGTPAQFNKDGFIYVNQSKFVVAVKNHVGKEVTSTGACVAWSGICGIVQPTHSGVPSPK